MSKMSNAKSSQVGESIEMRLEKDFKKILLVVCSILFLLGCMLSISSVFAQEEAPTAKTTTDKNGNYIFSNLPAGKYKIAAVGKMPMAVVMGEKIVTCSKGETLKNIDIEVKAVSKEEIDLALNVKIERRTGDCTLSGKVWGKSPFGTHYLSNVVVIASQI